MVTRGTRGGDPVDRSPEAGFRPSAPSDPAAEIEQLKGAAKAEYESALREVKSEEDALAEATRLHTEGEGFYQAAVNVHDAAVKNVQNMRDVYNSRYADKNARAANEYKRKLDRETFALKALLEKRNAAYHARAALSKSKKAQAGELQRAKAVIKEAKSKYEAFFGKSETLEKCPACDHNYTIKNGTHTINKVANVPQFSCLCFKYAKNCKQCPVCSITVNPDAPFSLETTNACQCPICKYVTLPFPSCGAAAAVTTTARIQSRLTLRDMFFLQLQMHVQNVARDGRVPSERARQGGGI